MCWHSVHVSLSSTVYICHILTLWVKTLFCSGKNSKAKGSGKHQEQESYMAGEMIRQNKGDSRTISWNINPHFSINFTNMELDF